MRHRAKFRKDRSNRSWDMADFAIFKDGARPPSWICLTPVGTTHEEYLVVFVTMQKLVVIGSVISILYANFNILHVISLKMPIDAPKIGVFGGFYPQNGEQYERDPQNAHLWAETRRMT